MSIQPIAIEVHDLWVRKGGGFFGQIKSILQGINFTVQPGEFVAVVGPNGAGKTTMIKAVVGDKPAHGQIRFRQGNDPFEDVYDNPEYWLRKIGYVPVDNVLHDDLTIHQALLHVGRLRLPNATDAEIEEQIISKLETFGIGRGDPRYQQPIRTLSSGEKKKVNIAAELLTDPPLLLLDEPTSNLDPNAERDLMDKLHDIAGTNTGGAGPTILLITHTLESIDRCDKVAFIANSQLLTYDKPEAVFLELVNALPQSERQRLQHIDPMTTPFEYWAQIFDQHQTNDTVAKRLTAAPTTSNDYPVASERPVAQDSFWRQLGILFSRYFTLRLNDLSGIATMLISGFVVGFLMLFAPAQVFLEADDATNARQTVVLYVILVVIMGAFTSHREISKEFRIFIHERAKGLHPLAYIIAKMIWMGVVIGVIVTLIILALAGFPLARWIVLILGAVVAVLGTLTAMRENKAGKRRTQQILQILWLAAPLVLAFFAQFQFKELPTRPLDALIGEILVALTLILCSLTALMLGLLVSAFVAGNNDRATQLVIATILINVVLAFSALVVGSREVQVFFDRLEPLAITHWGYRGFVSSIGVYCWAGATPFENFNSWGHIIMTWLLLIAHFIGTMALAVFALRTQETWMSRQRLTRSILRSAGTYAAIAALAVFLSWAAFLSQRSNEYYQLTFFDRLDSSRRYARVVEMTDITFMQRIDGIINQSICTNVSENMTAQLEIAYSGD